MNKIVLFSLCALAVVATSEAAAAKFTTKYDNVNLDEILSNERLFKQYTDCILDKGKCTTDGGELKSEYFGPSGRRYFRFWALAVAYLGAD